MSEDWEYMQIDAATSGLLHCGAKTKINRYDIPCTVLIDQQLVCRKCSLPVVEWDPESCGINPKGAGKKIQKWRAHEKSCKKKPKK